MEKNVQTFWNILGESYVLICTVPGLPFLKHASRGGVRSGGLGEKGMRKSLSINEENEKKNEEREGLKGRKGEYKGEGEGWTRGQS